MTQVVRYLVENTTLSKRATGSKAAVREPVCLHCNYSNNYYGDQVCVPRAR